MSAYIGVSGKARKVKNFYIGVNGKARKVKKAYIGVNGKARLFYSSGVDLPDYKWKVSSVGRSAEWMDIAYGAGVFVAVANGTNQAARSSDGINWTLFSIPGGGSYNTWSNIIYAGGKFVATAGGGSAYSTDGINWTAGTSSSIYDDSGLVYDGSQYISASNAYSGTREFSKSSNGISWTKSSVSADDSSGLHSFVYFDGLFFIATYFGGTRRYGYLYSYDAITWYSMSGYVHTIVPVSGNDKAFWVDGSDNKINSIDSSRNREESAVVGTGFRANGVIYAEESPLILCTSTAQSAIVDFDGGNVKYANLPVSQNFIRAAYGNGRWVLIAQNTSTFVYSE